MNLCDFGLLADENIHDEVVAFLRTRGFDVLDVREQGMAGSDDLSLIRLAHAEDRVVMTHDSDFGMLAVAGSEPFTGILYLRPGHIEPQFTAASLRTLLDTPLDLRPGFVLVARRAADHVQIRLRIVEEP